MNASTLNQYKSILAKFMDYYKGTNEYSTSNVPIAIISDADFQRLSPDERVAKKYVTKEELFMVTPEDVEKWLIEKVYSVRNTTFDDLPADAIANFRSDTIETYKKSLSYFMPNKIHPWNEVLRQGNPTKSSLVNNLVKGTRQKELREAGKKSSARRELDPLEYQQTLLKLNSFSNDIIKQFMIPTVLKFQFHMIARIDDTMNFKEKDIKPHPLFRFALQAKMRWSKNLHDERNVPDQILLGAMDTKYCILLGLAMYCEIWLERNMGTNNDFLFGHLPTSDGNKALVSRVLKADIWEQIDFIKSRPGLIGTHSMRKYPATLAGNTCSEHEIEVRGRWKSAGCRIVRRYISNELPVADAKVASHLCVGGACKYTLNEQAGITDAWLLEHVVPHICRLSKFQSKENVALILALPLLWASMDEAMEPFMPASTRTRIRTAYELIRVLPEDQNPVQKIPLFVSANNNGALQIDSINYTLEGGMEVGTDRNMAATILNSNNALFTHFMVNQQEVRNLQLQVQQFIPALHAFERQITEMIHEQTHLINGNIRRLACQPGRQLPPLPQGPGHEQRNLAATVHRARPAELSPNPKSLFVLWDEYMVGIGGRLPAKDFNTKQRGGQTKHRYHRRKIVWDQILKMVNLGYSSATAIDAIYVKYGGRASVTKIIDKMKAELKTPEGIVI